MKRWFIAAIAALLLFPIVSFAQTSTWQRIQEDILDPNCITCHRDGTTFATQSGLVLTADQAYDNLVGVVPKNTSAANDGLLRVSTIGLTGPHQSFLWEKINAPNQTHFYQDHSNYGSIMPLGLPPLTNGEIDYITKWIEAGAPREGDVVDVAVLADTARYIEPPFQPLPRPESGFQFHLGPYDVWSSDKFDREFLYFWPEITTEDVYVSRYEIIMRPGSHHFIMYNYPAGAPTPPPHQYRDMRDQFGNNNIPNLVALGSLFPFRLFVGTQTPYINFDFPPGIALRLPAGSGFDLNSHSVNRSGQVQPGEVYANLYTVDRSQVQHVAEYDNIGNFDITLPPNQVTTLTFDGMFEEDRYIIQMWTHSHEHTVEFTVHGIGGENDGDLLYWTNDWEHPPLLHLDPPLTVKAGEGLRLTTTYNNWTNQTIRFGPLSSDEMMFVFYVYYTDETSDIPQQPPMPEVFTLRKNYPNPFNPGTNIEYTLENDGPVLLKVYNAIGQEIETLVNTTQQAGVLHSATFDASGLPTGIYFYRLEADGRSEIKKMLFLK